MSQMVPVSPGAGQLVVPPGSAGGQSLAALSRGLGSTNCAARSPVESAAVMPRKDFYHNGIGSPARNLLTAIRGI